VKTYSNLSREAYFAIVDEARKQNIPFAGHVPFAVGADEVSSAGQKSMEHLNQLLETCSSQEQELLRVPAKDWTSAFGFRDQSCHFGYQLVAVCGLNQVSLSSRNARGFPVRLGRRS
jgi:hypothetical protein